MGTILKTNKKRRENLVTFSQNFENEVWERNEVNVVSNAGIAPDGTMTADKVIPSTSNTIKSIVATGILPTRHNKSVYAKADGFRYVQLNWTNLFSLAYVNFDLIDGVVTTNVDTIPEIKSVGDGWFRISCSVTGVYRASGKHSLPTIIPTATTLRATSGVESFVGDNIKGVLVWGAQISEGEELLPYTPTLSTIFKP